MQRVRALIKGHVSAMLVDKEKHATMLTELRSLSSEKRLEVIKLCDEYELPVRTILNGAQVDGTLRDDIFAKYLALCLLNLLNWAIFWYQTD